MPDLGDNYGSCISKRRYGSETDARRARVRAEHERPVRLRVYGCTACGGWHLTKWAEAPVAADPTEPTIAAAPATDFKHVIQVQRDPPPWACRDCPHYEGRTGKPRCLHGPTERRVSTTALVRRRAPAWCPRSES